MQAVKAISYTSPVSKFCYYARQKKHECLLVSFMLLMFTNTFSDQLNINLLHEIGFFNIFQNMLTGLFIFYRRKHLRNMMLLLISFSLFLTIFSSHLSFIDVRSWRGITYLIFFFLIAKEVYKEVLYSKTVTRELLAAALCGFILLGLIGTFLFYQIDIKIPHSFSNSGEGRNIMNNLNYFSFTTLLTIGYGDITPVSLVAKRAVMLMGIAGHFYNMFVISIIIGKYLSTKRS
jgi:voltage-gated potassium channel